MILLMSKATQQLLKDALKLRSEERAELAAKLLASLDGEPDENVDYVWAAEIERRAERARSGEDPGTPWPDVKERLRRKLRDR